MNNDDRITMMLSIMEQEEDEGIEFLLDLIDRSLSPFEDGEDEDGDYDEYRMEDR